MQAPDDAPLLQEGGPDPVETRIVTGSLSSATPEAPFELAARVRVAVVPLARLLRQQAGGVLTATQGSVLGSINRHGPISMSDLAAREQLSPPMITKVVTALEDKGFVERVSDPCDGRVSLAYITAAGDGWLMETRERRDRWLAERIAELDESDLESLRAALPTLMRLSDEPGT